MQEKNIQMLLGIVALVIIAFIGYIVWANYFESNTMDPNCDPTACEATNTVATSTNQTATSTPAVTNPSWKTATDTVNRFVFMYPENLGTKYISTVDWPPKIQVLKQSYNCTQAGSTTDRGGKTEEKTLAGITFCATQESEGAAGSVYNQYAYAFDSEGNTVIFTFTTREVQCLNYDEPQSSECVSERNTFNIDTIISGVAQTLRKI